MTCSQKPRASRWRGSWTQARRIPQPSTFPFFLQRKQRLRSPECPRVPEIVPSAPPSASHLTCSLEGGVRIRHEKGRIKRGSGTGNSLAEALQSSTGAPLGTGSDLEGKLPPLGSRPCRGVGLGCTFSKGQPHLPVPISRGCCPSHGMNNMEKEVNSGLSGSWEEGRREHFLSGPWEA